MTNPDYDALANFFYKLAYAVDPANTLALLRPRLNKYQAAAQQQPGVVALHDELQGFIRGLAAVERLTPVQHMLFKVQLQEGIKDGWL